MAMQISQRGIDLIKRFEGLELEAYDDGGGVWTIGYGHIKGVTPGMVITAAEAEQLLREDLVEYVATVNRIVNAPMNQPQFDALVSLAFNIGSAAISRSTAIKRLNKRDYLGAAEAITWWNKVNGEVWPGLVRRRTAEAEMFLEDLPDGVEEAHESRATPEENKPRRDNPVASRTTEGAVIAGAGGAAGAGAAMIDDGPEDTGTSTGTADGTGTGETTGTGDGTGETDTTETGTGETTGEGTTTGTVEQPTGSGGLDRKDYVEAFQIAAGVIVVLAVLYILFARFDDWFKWRR